MSRLWLPFTDDIEGDWPGWVRAFPFGLRETVTQADIPSQQKYLNPLPARLTKDVLRQATYINYGLACVLYQQP